MSNDYIDRLGDKGQISSLDELTSQDPGTLTETQLNVIIREIDIAIINIRRERRGNFASYSFGGASGRSASPAESIKTLMELRKFYKELLDTIPVCELTIYESPDIAD